MIKSFSRATVALIAVSACLSACAPKQSSVGASVSTSAATIVNGTDVKVGDEIQKSTAIIFSWNQKTGDVELCSASLITKDLLVTAAHCLVDAKNVRFTDDYQLYVSFKTSLNLKDGTILDGAMVIPSAQAIPNAAYKNEDTSDTNDIALIKLPQDAPAGQVPVAILPDDSILKKPNVQAVVAGFGVSSPDGSIEQTTGVYLLRSMNTFILGGFEAQPDVIPTANWGDVLETNHGDSGGPGFVTVDGKTYLFGADSSGNDHYAFYTNLRKLMPWLKATATMLKADSTF